MEIEVIALNDHQRKKTLTRGYFRYLLSKKAVLPTNKEHQFAMHKEALIKLDAARLVEAQSQAEKLKTLDIQIKSRVVEGGRLYGSVGVKDLAAAITDAGVSVSKNDIRLLNGSIRRIGEHTIAIDLHEHVQFSINVRVVSTEDLVMKN